MTNSPVPLKDSDFSITTTLKETNFGSFTNNLNQMAFTNIIIEFKPHVSIPAGYTNGANPVGEIIIKFNTLDRTPGGFPGFPLNLDI